MQAVFSAPDDAEHRVVAKARWTGEAVDVEAADPGIGTSVRHAFRPTPVVTADPSYRALGTTGEVQIQPGTLEWFRAAANVRAPAETGLAVRLVPGLDGGGFDPAAGYRTFEEQMERLDRTTGDRR